MAPKINAHIDLKRAFSISYHAGQKEDDDEGIHDGKPLDVGVRHGVEDVIPPRRPLDGAVFLPLHAEGVVDLDFVFGIATRDAHRLGALLSAFAALDAIVTLGLDVDFDDASGRRWQDLITPLQRLLGLVIRDGEFDMIEDVIRVL